MSDTMPMSNLRQAVRDAIHNLQEARDIAYEDPDALRSWPALRETADKIAAVLARARALLPLHPDIEAAAEEEWWEMNDGADRAEALRG